MKEQQGSHFIDLISEHLHITMAIIPRHFHFMGHHWSKFNEILSTIEFTGHTISELENSLENLFPSPSTYILRNQSLKEVKYFDQDHKACK